MVKVEMIKWRNGGVWKCLVMNHRPMQHELWHFGRMKIDGEFQDVWYKKIKELSQFDLFLINLKRVFRYLWL